MNDRSIAARAQATGAAVRSRAATPRDAVNGVAPCEVVTPRDEDETAAVIAAARAERLALVVRGGGSQLETGNRPRALDALVDTSAMDSIVERNPEDLTVTVQAGVTLAALGDALTRDAQRFAVDSSDAGRSTIGGVVAANAAGGLAHGFGTPRDLVLGMRVVDGNGRKLKLGGRVVKNVAGYDLVRLFCGSFGTLGVITELTVRTHPVADVATTVIVQFARAADVEAARAALFHSELPLAAFDLETAAPLTEPLWRLVLRLEGTAPEVSYQIDRCVALCTGGKVERSSDWSSPIAPERDENLVIRCGTLPARAVAFAERLAGDVGTLHRLAARLGDGTVRAFARVDADDEALPAIDAVRSVARAGGASVIVERAPPDINLGGDAWGDRPAGFALMREIKKRFDPDGVLAPGRFAGGL